MTKRKGFLFGRTSLQTAAIQSMQNPVIALTQANILVIEVAAVRQAVTFLVPSRIPRSHNMLTL